MPSRAGVGAEKTRDWHHDAECARRACPRSMGGRQGRWRRGEAVEGPHAGAQRAGGEARWVHPEPESRLRPGEGAGPGAARSPAGRAGGRPPVHDSPPSPFLSENITVF